MTLIEIAPALPQLELVRDPERMRRVWASLMPGHRIEACETVLVRYDPAKNKSCLVCYRLTIRQGARTGSQILCGRFYAPGESFSRFRQAQRSTLATPAFGKPLYHLPEFEGVVWAFPNDCKVPGIPALLDRQRLATDVVPQLVHAAGVDAATGEVSLELVQYNPERGCVVRVTAPMVDGRSRVFYGKAYNCSEGEETYRHMCELWQASQRPPSLRVAQPLAYDPQNLTLWQSAVEGATLAEFDKTPGRRRASLFEAVGGAVAVFHSIPVQRLKLDTPADACARLEAAAGRLTRVQPRLAGRVASLESRLYAQAGCLEKRPSATLHGCLHARNVVSACSGIGFIDLDGLRAGDPLQDLGTLIASICRHGIEHEVSAADIAQMARAVQWGYETNAPWGVVRRALRWHTTAVLLSEAERRAKRVNGGPCLEALLDAAGAALSGSGLLEPVL